jgi:flavin reductase (DIM6/NTAB) family NADH-FMN oxidoreductase RutF
MTDTAYFYEAARGHGLPHDPFKAIVAPRPIGWISTRDRDGRANLAPYSFFNAVCDRPPMVAFSSSGYKDTIANVESTGEFVYNLATKALAAQMNQSSAAVPHEINEFTLAGLTEAACRMVEAPRVAEAPAALECRLIQIVRLNDLDGNSAEHYLAVGQVVGVHIDPRYLKDGRFDLAAADPIQRAGYLADYVEMGKMFQMTRPK